MTAARKRKASEAIGNQAPAGAWTPATLLSALRSGTSTDKRNALRKAGILDATGNLTKTYKNWGSTVTRTPDARDVEG